MRAAFIITRSCLSSLSSLTRYCFDKLLCTRLVAAESWCWFKEKPCCLRVKKMTNSLPRHFALEKIRAGKITALLRIQVATRPMARFDVVWPFFLAGHVCAKRFLQNLNIWLYDTESRETWNKWNEEKTKECRGMNTALADTWMCRCNTCLSIL